MRLAPGFCFLPFLATLIFGFLSACLTNPSGPPTQEPTTITLSTYRIVFTAVDDYERVDATVLDQDSRVISDATVHWRSADGSIARVSDRGVVTASGNGTTQITVSSGYATATVTVSVEQAADSVEIMPSAITLLQVGATGQFTVVVYDANDRIIPGAVVVWSSSNPEIATVDANGLVTAVSPGDALITASSGGASTSRPVYVEVAPEPSRIVLNISEATLAAVGQSLQLDAQVYDDNDAAIPGAAVMWSSSRPEVATVDASGLVIAVSNGTTRVTATSGDASAHALVHVVIEGTEPPEPQEPPDPPPTEPPEPPPPPPPPPEMSTDRDVLVALYNATDGPNWTDNTNWLSDAPLNSWYGVNAKSNGRVTYLGLRENNLTGTIPPQLGQLTELTQLFLDMNQLKGGIPPELGQLSNLELMLLGNNELTGHIPLDLIKLRNLLWLFVEDNQLSGSIPPELGNMTSLEILNLGGNRLTDNIPSDLGKLVNLRNLHLYDNQLSGSIPREMGELGNLTVLDLFDNRLSGNIPPELGKLKQLVTLQFQNNELTGSIPRVMGKLGNLTGFNVNNNRLSGSIPSELGQLENVVSLYLSYNQLVGGLPPELGDLSNLKTLVLSNNQGLTGPLPRSLTGIELEGLRLESTNLCVPAEPVFQSWVDGIMYKAGVSFCEDDLEPSTDRDALIALYHATDGPNWTNNTNWLSDKPLHEWHGVTTAGLDERVIGLDLFTNQLTGVITAELGRLQHLEWLHLGGNQLTGIIPAELGRLRNLSGYLALDRNQLTGPIPRELGQLQKLKWLSLEGNELTGAIPAELGQLQNLLSLDLEGNDLTGAIPAELGQLQNLEVLQLRWNKLTGEIPAELGRLQKLERLDFNDNELTGEIPAELGRLQNLWALILDNNGLTRPIPPELGSMRNLQVLCINRNNLSGDVPSTLGNLASLRVLGLSHNTQMSGALPSSLLRLSNLVELRLNDTGLCAPSDTDFQTWLDGLTFAWIDGCE